MNIKLQTKDDVIEITIDHLIHLFYVRSELVALYSYCNDEKHFFIDLKFKTTSLKIEYDSEQKWREILQLLTPP